MTPPANRPLSVTAVGYLFIAAGVVGIAYHASELRNVPRFEAAAIWILLVRLIAIVTGVFILRGASWGRSLALVWMAYHVILSALHSWSEAVTHLLLLAVIVYALFNPSAAPYFRRSQPAL